MARAQATARASLSVATMRADGRAAPSATATAPDPVHRSMAFAVVGQAGGGAPGQLQALPAGDVDPGVDGTVQVAEGGPAR